MNLPIEFKHIIEQVKHEKNIVFPFIMILVMISVVSAIQEYFVFFKGIHSIINFFLHIISQIIYYLYFIPVGILLLFYSKKLKFSSNKYLIYTTIHLITLMILLYSHQFLAYSLNKSIFGESYKSTFYKTLYTNPYVWADLIIYILGVLGFSLQDSLKKNRENKLNFSNLELELIRTKLFELRSKIHPQFLFKTLDTISRLVKSGKNKDANKLLSKLSDFLRKTVYNSEQETITLSDDLEFLRLYLEIESISLDNEIVLKENISQDFKDVLVPNFFLQSIIEELLYIKDFDNSNAIVFDINCSSLNHKLNICISLFSKVILLVDNLGKSQMRKHIEDQLKQIYNSNYEVRIDSKMNNEFQITIQIPFQEINIYNELNNLDEVSL